MKYTITIECEHESELIPYTNAIKNQLKLDCLYDEVFRKILKYSENPKEIHIYQMVWDKLSEYLQD
jgi:hypothetical protein